MDDLAVATAAPITSGAAGGAPRTLQLRRGEAPPAMLAKLKEIGRGFDAVFTGTLLGELMKPAIGAGLGGSGPGASIVQGLIESTLADHLGKSGGFGIGRMLEKSLEPLLATEAVDVGALERNEGLKQAVRDGQAADAATIRAAVIAEGGAR